MKTFTPLLILGFYAGLALGTEDPPAVSESVICNGPHEVYSECGDNPCTRNCANFGGSDQVCAAVCIPGCACEEGFLRNRKGICVLPQQCDPKICTGPHEVYTQCDNNSCATKSCATYGRGYLERCAPSCIEGCICEGNYLRNGLGVCVHPLQCEHNICRFQNEQYSDCVSPCGETCLNLGQQLTCDYDNCLGGCDCKPGFFMNGTSLCVPAEECDCGGESANQELDLCHNPCPPEGCDSIGKKFKCADPDVCKPACKCKRNYKRNSSGQCVNIRECPQPFECNNATEVYDACPGFCMDERCVREPLLPCSSMRIAYHICRPECRCQEGYCRNEDGECIDNKPYESCGGDPNAYLAPCGDPYPTTCENKYNPKKGSKVCLNAPACKCKHGYVKDFAGMCILPEDCPKCDENEIYKCGSACDTTCATLGEVCPIVNEKCTLKCYCKDGYARNHMDICIPISDCPPCKADINASTCRCKCKKGFTKNKYGKCVAAISCTDPNSELVFCPNPCPGGTCAMPTFMPCKLKCPEQGCQCKKGYVKKSASDPTCIALKKCTKKRC